MASGMAIHMPSRYGPLDACKRDLYSDSPVADESDLDVLGPIGPIDDLIDIHWEDIAPGPGSGE